MLNNDNWINPNDHMPEEDEYVLVILRHTYPDNYWEYDIARNIVLHDKPYWCSIITDIWNILDIQQNLIG